jgi:VPDSG-CTERM motif
MRNVSKTMLALLATGIVSCALFGPQAQADQITGQISFSGVVRLNSPSLLTATAVQQWRDVFNHNPGFTNVTGDPTGDFGTFVNAGDLAHFATPWTFGLVSGGPQAALWSVGGFTFNLLSSTVDMRTAVDLIIHGTGTITGNGFDATPGTWDFHITNAGGQNHQSFSFAASTSGVPDGGSAIALLGIALAGIEVVRKKIQAKAAT